MKTTVEISDALLAKAKKAALRERTTVRALIEEGLRKVLKERNRSKPFQLKDASFKGKGMQAKAKAAGWDKIRDMAYDGRGS